MENGISEFGYSVFGPLLYEFNRWLCEAAAEKEVAHLFFLAREGWFLQQLYKEYRALHPEMPTIPSSYLLASRRALFGAAQKNPEVLRYAMSHAHYNGQLFDLVETRIGVGGDDLRRAGLEDRTVQMPRDAESVSAALETTLDLLNQRAAEERDQFESYLRREGFYDHRRIGVVDVGYSGTIQRFLHEITGVEVTGFYAGARERTSKWTTPSNDLLACYGIAPDHDDDLPLMRFQLYLEGWLSSPNGQLLKFVPGPAGPEPIFGPPGKVQRSFETAQAISDSVTAYFRDAAVIGVGSSLDPRPLQADTQYLMGALLKSAVYDETASFITVEDSFCNMGEIQVAAHYRRVLEAEARARA